MLKSSDKRQKKSRAALVLLLSLAYIICSACAVGEPSSSAVTAATLPDITTVSASAESKSETSEAVSLITEASSSASESTLGTTAASSSETEETTETTAVPLTEETAATSLSELIAEVSYSSDTAVSEITASETAASQATEQTEETTTPESVPEPVTEAEKPPAVIYAKSVSSPAETEKRSDTAVIDYSNASLGYISAAYSGKSARAKLRIVCGDITYDHDLAVTGEAEYFPLSQGSGDYRIQIYEQLEGKVYSVALELEVSVSINDETEMYLYPNKYVWFDKSSDCAVKASELCAGEGGAVERLAAIFKYITDNITYDYDLAATVKSGYVPDPDSVLSVKKGICFDYASLFAAMARSQDIPTRLVIGYAAPDIYHAWNEVYTEETGWITPELLLKEKGYNIVDATFYGSANDKNAIAEYISDNGNYSAVYRY